MLAELVRGIANGNLRVMIIYNLPEGTVLTMQSVSMNNKYSI